MNWTFNLKSVKGSDSVFMTIKGTTKDHGLMTRERAKDTKDLVMAIHTKALTRMGWSMAKEYLSGSMAILTTVNGPRGSSMDMALGATGLIVTKDNGTRTWRMALVYMCGRMEIAMRANGNTR